MMNGMLHAETIEGLYSKEEAHRHMAPEDEDEEATFGTPDR